MKSQRAKEILDSPKTIEVKYNEIPVWIENVDISQNTALVSSGSFNDGKKMVPVDQLTETANNS